MHEHLARELLISEKVGFPQSFWFKLVIALCFALARIILGDSTDP
jgi:hypothetical protein